MTDRDLVLFLWRSGHLNSPIPVRCKMVKLLQRQLIDVRDAVRLYRTLYYALLEPELYHTVDACLVLPECRTGTFRRVLGDHRASRRTVAASDPSGTPYEVASVIVYGAAQVDVQLLVGACSTSWTWLMAVGYHRADDDVLTTVRSPGEDGGRHRQRWPRNAARNHQGTVGRRSLSPPQ